MYHKCQYKTCFFHQPENILVIQSQDSYNIYRPLILQTSQQSKQDHVECWCMISG